MCKKEKTQKNKRPYSYRKERKREKRKKKARDIQQGKSKQNKSTPLNTKGKGKQQAEVNESERMDVNKCPICDMKWEDDDGENGEWLGASVANGYMRIVLTMNF